jgi:UDP-2,4-diacetamido-2,4,6-trideoxy-beta-L-altropyranose hydrolase
MCQVEQQSKSERAYTQWLGCDWQRDAQETSDCIGFQETTWLVVDHYALDERWQKQLRFFCNKIMIIDDLADRHHDCDLLLDQTLGRSSQDYESLVSKGCTLLTGAKFALLRPEFSALRGYSLNRRKDQKIEHLLISMGGIDKDNVTEKVLRSLNKISLSKECRITIVMGENAPWLDRVKCYAGKMFWPTEVKANVENMAQLMADSDLAIGAAGSTSWERCCLGLPTLMMVLADNQKVIANALQNHGAALTLGEVSDRCLLKSLENVLDAVFLDIDNIKKMITAAYEVTDGRGAFFVSNMMLLEG